MYYLGTDAIEDTLRFIGTRPTGTEVVFDYIDPTPAEGNQASQVTAGLGEPLVSEFTPAEIADLLGRTGLQVVQDLSPADAAAMYFVGRPSGRVPPVRLASCTCTKCRVREVTRPRGSADPSRQPTPTGTSPTTVQPSQFAVARVVVGEREVHRAPLEAAANSPST